MPSCARPALLPALAVGLACLLGCGSAAHAPTSRALQPVSDRAVLSHSSPQAQSAGNSSGGVPSIPPPAAVPMPPRSPTPPTPPTPLAGRVVTIDPGHNGGNFNDPQAIGRLVNDGNGQKECDTTGTAAPDGYREADFNWSVAQRLRALLRAAGARVVMTRLSNTGVGPCITERAAIGNRARSSVAISIHADGGPAGGSGFAILIPASIPSRANQAIVGPSRRFALSLRTSLERAGLHPSTYDGVEGLAPRTDLGGLNLSRVPKVFVEVANMQNRADEAPLERASFRDVVAHALFAALERFLAQH